MVKTSNVCLIALIAFVVGIAIGVLSHRQYSPCINLPVVSYDTIVVRDTVTPPIPPPKEVKTVRVDTLRIEIDPVNRKATIVDTVKDTQRSSSIAVPIESRTYQTSDYRAVISGWHPSLDTMQIYRQVEYITKTERTVKRPVWALTANVGAGYTTTREVLPYVGLGVGLVLWSK